MGFPMWGFIQGGEWGIEIIGIELAQLLQEGGKLVEEEETICSWLHDMKKGFSMCFWPIPIMHPMKPIYDEGARTFVIIKPCGYCNQYFHCHDVAMTGCKHTFHPFCLCVMLKNSNNYCVCKQKLHLNWWSNWEICETNEEMKKLAK